MLLAVGNLAFTMPFMPQTTKMHDSDIWGLIVIMAGLMLYRFTAGPSLHDDEEDEDTTNSTRHSAEETERTRISGAASGENVEDGLREPLLQGDI